MAMNDEDVPVSYLVYVIAVTLAMGLLVVGAFFLLFR